MNEERTKGINSKYVYDAIIGSVLFVLIIFRLVGNLDKNIVDGINFCGMAIAFVSILLRIKNNIRKTKRPSFFAIIIIIVLVLIFIASSIFFNNLIIRDEWNDAITLAALFFSIPDDLIVDLFSPKKKK